MGQLGEMLLSPEQRTHGPAPIDNKENKTREQKTGKQAIRKVGSRGNDRIRAVELDRPYGERGDFEKITLTLPSDVRGIPLDELLRRKKQRSRNWPIAAIVREAIAAYLMRKD